MFGLSGMRNSLSGRSKIWFACRICAKSTAAAKKRKIFDTFIKKNFSAWSVIEFCAIKDCRPVVASISKIWIERFVKKSGLLKIFSSKLEKAQSLSPRIDEKFFDEQYPEIIFPKVKPKYKVGFLTGCIMNVAYSKVHEDTIKVLLHHECQIIIPKNQVCCGSLQAHNGDFDIARELAKKILTRFYNLNLMQL